MDLLDVVVQQVQTGLQNFASSVGPLILAALGVFSGIFGFRLFLRFIRSGSKG